MPEQTFSQTVAAGQTAATVTVPSPQSSIAWKVWQVSVESIPTRNGAITVIKRNGRLITAGIIAANGATASGPPAISFTSGDSITVDFSLMQAGDECIVNVFYTQVSYNDILSDGSVV